MKDIWNSRYASKEYVYGVAPNQYFEKEIKKLPKGKILLPAEGEGRNAVYAAKQGWKVSAFDISDKGREKALQLADKNHVDISYDVFSIEDISYPNESFDCIGVFFMHLPLAIQSNGFQNLFQKLKKGGSFILEVFSKKQLEYNTGGPKNLDMLFSIDELKHIFKDFSSIKFEENEVVLDEGALHKGKAVTIRGYGIKE